jgi:hypothetical protein
MRPGVDVDGEPTGVEAAAFFGVDLGVPGMVAIAGSVPK